MMKPFIFEFAETPTNASLDFSLIEYSDTLNLSVDKRSGLPAINHLRLATETFTRTNEDVDSDRNPMQTLLATETATKEIEDTDADPAISQLMATETVTISHQEGSDSDIDVPVER